MLTFLALAHMLDATQDAGLGWGGCQRSLRLRTCCMLRKMLGWVRGILSSLHLHTCWMLRKMLGWGGGDVNVPCTCTHVACYARCWVGVGGMLTFLALAHMLHAPRDCSRSWMSKMPICFQMATGLGPSVLRRLALKGHKSSTVCFSLHELLQRMVAKSLLERK